MAEHRRRDDPPRRGYGRGRGSARNYGQRDNHHDRERERDREYRDRRDPRDRQRSRSPYRERSTQDTTPRTRSPPPRGPRDPLRARSPPRGPRRDRKYERDPSPERYHKPPGGAKNTTQTPQSTPRAPPTGPRGAPSVQPPPAPQISNVQQEDEDDDAYMRRIMGFGKFKSTKNTKVPGNDKNYGVRKEKTIHYRQYMNRPGGFNRPLSPEAPDLGRLNRAGGELLR